MAARVAGKVALVTGAARGQGRADAVRLAQEGADIIAVDVAAPLPGTFASLADHAVDADGDTWLGSHPFAISWILDDLTALADGTDQVGTVTDAAGRWTAFSAATAG